MFQLLTRLDQNIQELEEQDYFSGKDIKLKHEKELELENMSVHKVIFDDNYILESDDSSDDEEQIKLDSKLYMPEEAQEKIEETIEQDKTAEVVKLTDCWNQEFFRSGPKVNSVTFFVVIIEINIYKTIEY